MCNAINNWVAVRRVHWLRGRASAGRWKEERNIVAHEMQCTVRYYMHKSNLWATAISEFPQMHAGAAAYADRQSVRWLQLARKADRLFKINDPDSYDSYSFVPNNTK